MKQNKRVTKRIKALTVVGAKIIKPTFKGPVREKALIESGVKLYYNNFEVRPAGNENEVYPPNGYSKYIERWTAIHDGKLKGLAYGLPQALEHIEELRRSRDQTGKYLLARAKFEIVEITIIKTAYKTLRG